jgi:hypothetical protein
VIPGPDAAPDAWETLPPVEVSGTLFGDRSVTVKYQVCYRLSMPFFHLTRPSSLLRNR